MNLCKIYHHTVPAFIDTVSRTYPLQRLKGIGMNCGCEYTGFSGFRRAGAYTRFEHSIGTALIAWHFTGDRRQSISALLHDIATPVFAHVIDFLHGDHVIQESTEEKTLEIIKSSKDLVNTLSELGLYPEDVCDYHLFPIADNDTPKLSSDRLEYTLGNMVNFRFATEDTASRLYADLLAGTNEFNEPEIVFAHKETASEFARLSLKCSKVYSSDEDRYAMQRLAELIKDWIGDGLISEQDLYSTEAGLLDKVATCTKAWQDWMSFRSMSRIRIGAEGKDIRIIQAKKRHINPFVKELGRVTGFDAFYREELSSYLSTDFNYPISI